MARPNHAALGTQSVCVARLATSWRRVPFASAGKAIASEIRLVCRFGYDAPMRRRFQFSLKTLCCVLIAVAFTLGSFSHPEDALSLDFLSAWIACLFVGVCFGYWVWLFFKKF